MLNGPCPQNSAGQSLNCMKGTSNYDPFSACLTTRCGTRTDFEHNLSPRRLPFVCPPAPWGAAGRLPSCRGHPVRCHEAPKVVGQVLQADLGARPHDAERAPE